MDFNDSLSIRYGALTNQGKKLADYIRKHPTETIKMTAKALGEASGTSAAGVIRLCQHLGYTSFEQLKISLAKSVSNDDLSAPIDTLISPSDAITSIVPKLYQNQLNALQGTLDLIDYDKINETITLLKKARRVYLFAVGSSSLAAQELSHRLNRIGKTTLFLADGHTNLEYACIADKRDLVIGFSYSGETKEVYFAAECAKKRGAPVVVVTRNRSSTLSACASIVIEIPEKERRVRVGALASITSQMFITDILYMGLLQSSYEKYEDALLESSRIANKLRE